MVCSGKRFASAAVVGSIVSLVDGTTVVGSNFVDAIANMEIVVADNFHIVGFVSYNGKAFATVDGNSQEDI